MKISNRTDVGLPAGVSVDGTNKQAASRVQKEETTPRLSLKRVLKPFTGDLRSLGVTEILKELFDAAKFAAESGKILPRGSFLNISV